MGERRLCTAEVRGSNPLISTERKKRKQKFEEWYKQQYWDFPDSIRKPAGGYYHLDVQLAWRAFKAGREVPAEDAIDAIYAAWHGAGVDVAGGDWQRFVSMLPEKITYEP